MAEINCIINQTMLMSEPTKKIHLQEPLAYTNGQAHAMRVTVFNDDGSEMDLTGVSVSGNFVKADGNSVSPLTGTVSANTAEVLLTPSCYVVPGRFKFTMDMVAPASTRAIDNVFEAYNELDMSSVAARNHVIGNAMSTVFGVGNLNLLNRPQVDASALISAGYSDAGTGTATVYSIEYYMGSGTEGIDYAFPQNVILHITPIKADGSIVSKTNLESYIDTKLKTKTSISAMVDADRLASGGYGLILWAQPVSNWASSKLKAEEFDEYLHQMQAAYYLADTSSMPTEAQLRDVYLLAHNEQSMAVRTALWVEGMVEKNISGEITDPGTPVGNIAQAVAAANAAAQTAQGAMAQIGLAVNATPSTIPGVRVGWVPVTLDKTNAEVIQAAQSGKCVVNLPLYGETIICHQAERSGNSIYFIGMNVDNSALFVYAVLINASSAQAALLGSLAMTDLMPQSGNG